ncbi:hypothetical protein AX17_004951 [Amanita inopinata Kibby_2008]|nr:hypothetical protein AX17_004951 [Amanita inopinata Kibby_2008]
MVEELLIPATQSHSHFSCVPTIPQCHTHPSGYPNPHSFVHPGPGSGFDPSSPCPSPPFTSTDPFYMAQLQEMQARQARNDGAFASMGRPEEGSPFAAGQHHAHPYQLHQQWDPHCGGNGTEVMSYAAVQYQQLDQQMSPTQPAMGLRDATHGFFDNPHYQHHSMISPPTPVSMCAMEG